MNAWTPELLKQEIELATRLPESERDKQSQPPKKSSPLVIHDPRYQFG